jgi:ATP-binding cassette subfamily B protein
MNKFFSIFRFPFADFKRALLMLWEADKKLAIIHFLLQLLQALLPVLTLYFIKELVEFVTANTNTRPFSDLIPIIIWFGLAQLLLTLASQWSAYTNNVYQQKLTDHLSEQVLKKAVEVDYQYYENPEYHDTLHLAQLQSNYKMPLLLSGISTLVVNLFTLLGIAVFFFTIQSTFALLFILLSLPLTIIKWYYGFELFRLEAKFAPLEREANYLHKLVADVNYAKEARVFGFGSSFIKKFKTIRRHIGDQKKGVHLKLTWYSILAETLEVLVMVFIFGLLAQQTWQKLITVGAFVIYIQGFQRLQGSSRSFMQALVQVFQLRHFLKDLFAFLDIKPRYLIAGTTAFPKSGGVLSINNISFTYPKSQKQALKSIKLQCKPGEIIAIVGENGSGKSTLVKLLANLYPLQEGHIKIADTDLHDLDIHDFRKRSLFLFQDFEKYFFSVSENIALGDEDVNQEKMEKAAMLSGAAPFIKLMPNGYKTRMGTIFNESVQLSGGQWQKLVLSRVFYKDARLIILDEPTSALDPLAEGELFRNLKEHLGDKMIILVSHRLYNLKIADYIYMMKDGEIVQEGKFDELVDKGGEFKRMYQAQKI